MNFKIIIIPVVVLIIGIGVFSFISSDEKNEISEDVEIMKSEEPRKLIQTNVPSLFKVMAYENDFEIIDGEKSLVWIEAENRLYAHQAILLWCLKKI